MIKKNKAQITDFIIHKVGNKFNSTRNVFSDNSLLFDENSYQLMFNFLLKPFTNLTESYRFSHHADINLNEMNAYTKSLFTNEGNFVEVSQNIVKHLYEQSNSANIKTGDVLIARIEGIEINTIITDAIGIFKIENKMDFFQTYIEGNQIEVLLTQGISTKKLDKGCLIINTTDTEGTIVLSVDTNSYDAQYWIKNFLQIKLADDVYNHTKNYLSLCNSFSEEVIKENFGKKEQSEFLANTIDYFKENEAIDVEQFKVAVFDEDKRKDLFEDYKKQYETEQNVVLRNNFFVADKVLKKEKKNFKTEIKLDTRIKINIDVDSPDAASYYLERGYDDEKKMFFYKVFFNEES
ncbi:MAG: nucleoid-associated protein [Flavobacteriaceae bacterium]|nr:nucleoid-associated protein [Flavobacteriaceae bacterium]